MAKAEASVEELVGRVHGATILVQWLNRPHNVGSLRSRTDPY